MTNIFLSLLNALDVTSNWAVLGAGLGVGLLHALDADHLAAISTMMVKRRSLWRSALIGGWWGVGHSAALLAAGVAVILLEFRISLETENIFEFGVAVMLVGLGVNVLSQTLLKSGARASLKPAHVHPHLTPASGVKLGWRPLLIGVMHGLAGSAALLFLAVGQLPSTPQKFFFLIVFGLGSIGGMMLMSMLLSLPAAWTAERFGLAFNVIRLCAGAFSLSVGVWMVYEIGYVKGLFVSH